MPRLDGPALLRRQVRFFAADWRALGEIANGEAHRSLIVRNIVHAWIAQHGARLRAAIDDLERDGIVSVDLEEI